MGCPWTSCAAGIDWAIGAPQPFGGQALCQELGSIGQLPGVWTTCARQQEPQRSPGAPGRATPAVEQRLVIDEADDQLVPRGIDHGQEVPDGGRNAAALPVEWEMTN